MVGDGPLRAQLEAETVQLGLAGRVTWAGWQYDPAPWYQLADVFVCASRHEPLGNVILEAWANGVPVVSTAAQGPLELIEEGVDGLLAPLAAPERLAAVLRESLELDAAARLRLIEAGRAKLAANFSEEAIVKAYLDLYGKLASPYR
jgi:glycosyltransferase involved in cell wall biosynthesis